MTNTEIPENPCFMVVNHGELAPTRNPIPLSKSPHDIKMSEIITLVKNWVIERYSNYEFDVSFKILTPLEDTDHNRTLYDWVDKPTEFQKENHVDSENKYHYRYPIYDPKARNGPNIRCGFGKFSIFPVKKD